MGQLYNATWNNIGLRWYKPDLLDEETPIWKLGGLEMYINGQNVGSTLMAVTVDKEQDDLTEFSTGKNYFCAVSRIFFIYHVFRKKRYCTNISCLFTH